MNRKLKLFLGIAVLVASPLALVAALGAIYVAVHLIMGVPLIRSVAAFRELVGSLMPYSPYLTAVPFLLTTPLLLKKRAQRRGQEKA